MLKGNLVVIEGCDGVGKTTLVRMLSEKLSFSGVNHIVSREPSGDSVSEGIRDILLSKESRGITPVTELMLYSASRVQSVETTILPALKDGLLVLTDRFSLSSLCYQGDGRGLDLGLVRGMDSYVHSLLGDNIINIVLVPDYEVWLYRREIRTMSSGKDRLENESLEFHNRVYNGYKHEVTRNFNGSYHLVDASADINTVFDKVYCLLSSLGVLK